jgi:uncharacterized protein YndB with AHSA1/START domain
MERSMESRPVLIERVFNAPVQVVWQAITDKELMKQWYFDLADFKPEIGFEFRFLGGEEGGHQYLHICTITEVIPGRRIKYSWRYEGYEGISYVSFELTSERNGTRLILSHEGLESFPQNISDFKKENFVEGWTQLIGTALKEFLEHSDAIAG